MTKLYSLFHLNSSFSSVESTQINTDDLQPTLKFNVPRSPAAPWSSGDGNMGVIVDVTLDLFNLFDIPTDQRQFFYISPYMCLSDLYIKASTSKWGHHNYSVGGFKGDIRPVTRDPKDPRFGQFIAQVIVRPASGSCKYNLFVTANRFDNFVPTCDNPPPPVAIPPMPTDITIHVRAEDYNDDTQLNLVLRDRVESDYWNWIGQPLNITVKIHENAKLYGYSTSIDSKIGDGGRALDCRNFPNGTTIVVDNHGSIIGSGGWGGVGAGYYMSDSNLLTVSFDTTPKPGGPGDVAIVGDDVSLVINNHSTGTISGGGGGGAGSYNYMTFAGDVLAGGSGGGGASIGIGGFARHGTTELESDFPMFVDHPNAGAAGHGGSITSGGAGGVPGWSSTSYKIYQNDAMVNGYGPFTRYNGAGAAGSASGDGGDSSNSKAPAQGVIMLNNQTIQDGETLQVGDDVFTFQKQFTDTCTCWDGSIKTRDRDTGLFAPCPAVPLLVHAWENVSETSQYNLNYKLLDYSATSNTTMVTGSVKVIFDPDVPMNADDITNMPFTLSINNDVDDVFLLSTDKINKSKTIIVTQNLQDKNVVEFVFHVHVRDLPDAGDSSTILDGSPYYGDLKLEYIGFRNDTVGQLKLDVTKPSSVLLFTGDTQNTLTYNRTADTGNTYTTLTPTIVSNITGQQILPSGAVVDSASGLWMMQLDSGVQMLPHTLLPDSKQQSTHTDFEMIDQNFKLIPYDYISSYAQFGFRYSDDATMVLQSSTDFDAPQPGASGQLLIECWIQVNESPNDFFAQQVFGREQSYQMNITRIQGSTTTVQLQMTTYDESATSAKLTVTDVMTLAVGQWYHVGLLMTPTTTQLNIKALVDGTTVINKDVKPIAINSTHTHLSIGTRRTLNGATENYSSKLSDAYITEFRVWKSVSADDDLSQLFTTYKSSWNKRIPIPGNNPGGMPANLVQLEPLTTRVKDWTGYYQNGVNYLDAQDFDFDASGFPAGFADQIPVGEKHHDVFVTCEDNSTGDQIKVNNTIKTVKTQPIIATVLKHDASGPVVGGEINKMFRSNLLADQLEVVVQVTGLTNALTANGIRVDGGAGIVPVEIMMDGIGANLNIWSGDSLHVPVNQPKYGHIRIKDDTTGMIKAQYTFKVRISQTPADTDTIGIGQHNSLIKIYAGDDLIASQSLTSNLLPGNKLTKTFSTADTNFNINTLMQLNRNELLQRGTDGLQTSADIDFILTAGAGGGGGDINQIGGRDGSRGLSGNVLNITESIQDNQLIQFNIGTGGVAGCNETGKVFPAAGGMSGGKPTGGDGVGEIVTDDHGHQIIMHSGGGGGGFTQLLVWNADASIASDTRAGGGGGGFGAVEFGTTCDDPSKSSNPPNAQQWISPDRDIMMLDGTNLTTIAGDDFTTPSPHQTDGVVHFSTGINSTSVEPHQGASLVGVTGGGGGGIAGGLGGWNGSGGVSDGTTTGLSITGADGSFTVTCRCYTDNIDDVLSLVAQPAPPVTLPSGISAEVFEEIGAELDTLPNTIPAGTAFRVLGRLTRDANGDRTVSAADCRAAWYQSDGTLLSTNDDNGMGLGHPDIPIGTTSPSWNNVHLLPGFSFLDGQVAGTYYMVLSIYHSRDTYPQTSFPPEFRNDMVTALDVVIESINADGTFTELSEFNYTPDPINPATHVFVSCVVQ